MIIALGTGAGLAYYFNVFGVNTVALSIMSVESSGNTVQTGYPSFNSLGMVGRVPFNEEEITFQPSPFDERKFSHFTLSNGLEVVTISDENVSKIDRMMYDLTSDK